ncbi:MAG: hypothetical protein WC277_06580 [Bacilli bacterium]|jgi:hypothetical protein
MVRKKKEETIDIYINNTETVKITVEKRLLNRVLANRVDMDKLITTCFECILGEPGAPIGVLINPGQYATQTIDDDDIETRRLNLMDGREIHHEIEVLRPDLPYYQ